MRRGRALGVCAAANRTPRPFPPQPRFASRLQRGDRGGAALLLAHLAVVVVVRGGSRGEARLVGRVARGGEPRARHARGVPPPPAHVRGGKVQQARGAAEEVGIKWEEHLQGAGLRVGGKEEGGRRAKGGEGEGRDGGGGNTRAATQRRALGTKQQCQRRHTAAPAPRPRRPPATHVLGRACGLPITDELSQLREAQHADLAPKLFHHWGGGQKGEGGRAGRVSSQGARPVHPQREPLALPSRPRAKDQRPAHPTWRSCPAGRGCG